MSWNVSRFNITELSVGSNYLWTPDVVLVNSADRKYSRNREHYALILRHDGIYLIKTKKTGVIFIFCFRLCSIYVSRFMENNL
jgi:hypothetical protein